MKLVCERAGLPQIWTLWMCRRKKMMILCTKVLHSFLGGSTFIRQFSLFWGNFCNNKILFLFRCANYGRRGEINLEIAKRFSQKKCNCMPNAKTIPFNFLFAYWSIKCLCKMRKRQKNMIRRDHNKIGKRSNNNTKFIAV